MDTLIEFLKKKVGISFGYVPLSTDSNEEKKLLELGLLRVICRDVSLHYIELEITGKVVRMERNINYGSLTHQPLTIVPVENVLQKVTLLSHFFFFVKNVSGWRRKKNKMFATTILSAPVGNKLWGTCPPWILFFFQKTVTDENLRKTLCRFLFFWGRGKVSKYRTSEKKKRFKLFIFEENTIFYVPVCFSFVMMVKRFQYLSLYSKVFVWN